MFYYMYCALIMAGYSACGLLLGGYMMLYAGAQETDLGYLFMIQPMTIFLRPLICAQADRYQSHKQLLICFALITSIAYVPFILVPFVCPIAEHHIGPTLLEEAGDDFGFGNEEAGLGLGRTNNTSDNYHNSSAAGCGPDIRLRFWILVVAHLMGSVGFCGVRSLGDALAINFAKRTGAAFSRYRKYGALSFGSCGYLLGHINQNWLLPDFVPSFIVYSSSFSVLATLVYLWPNEYFRIVGQQEAEDRRRVASSCLSAVQQRDAAEKEQQQTRLPEGGEIIVHMARKLATCLTCRSSGNSSSSSLDGSADFHRAKVVGKQLEKNLKQQQQQHRNPIEIQMQKQQLDQKATSDADEIRDSIKISCGGCITRSSSIASSSFGAPTSTSTSSSGLKQTIRSSKKHLTITQQAQIFCLLIRRDFRIPLYLLIILYGGLVGYAGPNFVYTYMNKVCHEKRTCDAAYLAGLTMICYCFVESIVYIIIDRLCSAKTNRILLFEVTFISLIVHYYFYYFVLDQVSPYWFLFECLHGVEYGISLATSMELGYDFGNEVELLLPELVAKGIISRDGHDDQELVKLALMATMSGFCTLVYDGIGCILGSFIFGQITGRYSFNTTWLVIGTMALIGFVVIILVYAIGRCFHIRPQISKLKSEKAQQQQQKQQVPKSKQVSSLSATVSSCT